MNNSIAVPTNVVIPELTAARLYPPDASTNFPAIGEPNKYPGNLNMFVIPFKAKICSEEDSPYASANIIIGIDEMVQQKYP